jgi:signal transduction histidine kinase
MISERAGFMHELVEGLYHYILVEQAPDSQQESIDLDTLIHDVIAQNMNDRYTQDTIKVVSPLPSITGYYSQLFILFQNLIANALKYCQQAPQITIDCSTVESSDNIDYCEISIKDNGIGIDTDSMDRIFHPFVRGNTHGEFKGAGLGLSVVNRIVKNHQGFIDVESVLGEGSNFRVCLPLTK